MRSTERAAKSASLLKEVSVLTVGKNTARDIGSIWQTQWGREILMADLRETAYKVLWSGRVVAVQPRIRLTRSFDRRLRQLLGELSADELQLIREGFLALVEPAG